MIVDVIGQAATKGSTRAYPVRKADGRLGVRVTPDNPTLRSWEARVRAECVAAMQRSGEDLITRPTAVRLVASFRLPRPLKFSTPRYQSGRLHAPPHSVRPDCDKLLRALGDALRGAAYEDDAQVAQLLATKRYAAIGEPWGVQITVEPFEVPSHAKKNLQTHDHPRPQDRAESRQARRSG